MTEVSQFSFLDSFYNILCDTKVCSDVFIFDVIPSRDIHDPSQTAHFKTLNCLFISAVDVQIFEL